MKITKALVTVSLIVFWTVLVIIGTAAITSHQSGSSSPSAAVSNNTTNSDTAQSSKGSSAAPASNSTTLTMAEISKHNTASDCWLLVSGKVYNVTNYINSHPGGRQAIISTCGTDATVAFDTKDGRGSHSQYAKDLLSTYYIGDFNSAAVKSSTLNAAPPAPTAVRIGDDD